MLAPLLVGSTYSFHRGTASPGALARRARELGWGGLGLADRLGVHGYPVFAEACAEAGLKAVLAVELPSPTGRSLLVVETREGLARLTRLLSDREGRAVDPREELREALPGLALASEDRELLEGLDRGWRAYALLTPCNGRLWRGLAASGWPPLATGEVAFLEKGDRALQRLLLAIGRKATVHDVEEAELAPAEALLVGPEAFRRHYEEVPEALRENEELVERVEVSGLFDGFIFPRYPAEEGAAARLRTLVLEGAGRRYGEPLSAEVLGRLDYELAIIEEKSFADYFLVVRDIVRRASRTCGRGSAAASIVSYSLGITDVDPIRHDLYFERFLNPGRKDPPDIDVDFAWDERDELLAAVVGAYGELHAARVANHVCFQPRSALREAARAFGMPEGEIAAYERGISVDAGKTRSESGAEWREIASLASRIVGFPRHLSVHSGGLVLVPDRLADHVPLERSGSGIRVTAWDKDGVEAAGLVKIDLLGNRSLAVVRDALANLAENGAAIDETSWKPIDDPATEEMLARGDSMGVFYVESPAMRLLQKKTGTGDFAHLVIHSSIIRPAANAYINEYIDRLKGKPYRPLHPLLSGLFDETFGIMCYQEDVSKAAVAMAGFTPAEADKIRKILAHKDVRTRLESYREKFRQGASALGVSSEDAATVWAMIESFAGYSFVKAHSASYAMLSFRSAYLRCHHPAEFMAAVMSNHGGFYSTLAYASEARRMGLTLLAPDVNESELRCRGRGKTVRFGLEMIGRLGEACSKRIVGDRHRNGPYSTVADFARRVYPDREEAEALVGSGALDTIEATRPRSAKLMQLLRAQVERGQIETRGPELFGSRGTVTEWASRRAPSGRGAGIGRDPAELARRGLEAELRYLGTTLSVHPLSLFPQALALPRSRGCEIASRVGELVRLVGWPITAKPVLTSEDQPMEFVSFEDETALYEAVLFPEVYRAYRHLLFEPGPLLVSGRVEEDRGAVTLSVSCIERIRADSFAGLPRGSHGMAHDRSVALMEGLGD